MILSMNKNTHPSYELLALYGKARETLNRNDVIAAIKAGLKARSGKSWSVTGGRGTAHGWIRICVPKSKAIDEWGTMSDAQCRELAGLLGLERVHCQGESIPADHNYRRVYLARSAGLTPTTTATPYWD
jgi:hypothetical protein